MHRECGSNRRSCAIYTDFRDRFRPNGPTLSSLGTSTARKSRGMSQFSVRRNCVNHALTGDLRRLNDLFAHTVADSTQGGTVDLPNANSGLTGVPQSSKA